MCVRVCARLVNKQDVALVVFFQFPPSPSLWTYSGRGECLQRPSGPLCRYYVKRPIFSPFAGPSHVERDRFARDKQSAAAAADTGFPGLRPFDHLPLFPQLLPVSKNDHNRCSSNPFIHPSTTKNNEKNKIAIAFSMALCLHPNIGFQILQFKTKCLSLKFPQRAERWHIL